MRILSLILALTVSVSVSAQDIREIEKIKDWKLIKEMSGEIPNHPGISLEMYAAQIARGEDIVKLAFRADFPNGAPVALFRENAPRGFDISSIVRFVGKLEFNCATLEIKPSGGSGYIYQFNGKRLKSKEPPFTIPSGHVFAQYFCERGTPPTQRPTLKPKP